jgi:hypothetical protein
VIELNVGLNRLLAGGLNDSVLWFHELADDWGELGELLLNICVGKFQRGQELVKRSLCLEDLLGVNVPENGVSLAETLESLSELVDLFIQRGRDWV